MTRSAVVQDWFFAPGGSEEVAIELANLLPGSDVITSFIEPEYRPRLAGHNVRTWPLQPLLGPTLRYRSFLPLYPLWFGRQDLRSYDVVVSSSSAFARGVRTRTRAEGGVHITYVHSPMRYAWDLRGYLARSSLSPLGRLGGRVLRPWLRRWDRAAGRRPDIVVANSTAVRGRINTFWDRDAEVIHPPVRVNGVVPSSQDDGFLLVAARMLAYRRLDVAVEAANRLQRELILVGHGPEERRLKALAGPTVRFAGRVSRTELDDLMARCHAYVLPGEEDFGMAPVEAMAAGKPVLALRAGGALDTVDDGATGVLFDDPAVDDLIDAIRRADTIAWDPVAVHGHALKFDREVFRQRMTALFEREGVDPALYRTR